MTAIKSKPVEVVHLPGATLIHVRGVIDEHFDRESFIAGLIGARGPIIIDVGQVPRLTSFGVRELMTALRDAPMAPRFFVRCRPGMVAQFNSIPHFGDSSQIVTLYCPYVCTECDGDFEVLLDVRRGVPSTVPEAKCPVCRSEAEFDDIEESYFAYIASQSPAPLPQVVEALIDANYTVGRSFRIEKAVVGELTALWLYGGIDAKTRLRRYAEGLEGMVVVVLSGVTSVSDDGMSQLSKLLCSPGGDLYVARVPLSVARILAAAPSGCGRARVVSVVVEVGCPGCGQELEVDVTRAEERADTACRHCGHVVSVEVSALDAKILGSLPHGVPPVEVASYLDRHPMFDSEPGFGGAHDPVDRTPFGRSGASRRLSKGVHLGKYEIDRRIGIGGMAEIFLGRRVTIGGFEKEIVIKRILPHLAAQQRFVDMFLQEARIAAKLSHPNIVQIHDLGKDGDDYFIVMEHVRGMDLNAILKLAVRLDTPLPIEICCRIIADVAGALEAAHTFVLEDGTTQAVLHRDVSPHNVLVSLDGLAKLSDFGIAKAAGSKTDSSSDMLKGKVIYMAPETVLSQPVDHRIDIFAAGLMLYVCLTQRHPFRLTNMGDSLRAVVEGPIRPVRQLRPEIPDELAGIVERAITRDPEHRTPTAARFQQELLELLGSYGKPSGAPALARWLEELMAAKVDLGRPTVQDVPTSTRTLPEDIRPSR